MQVRILRGAIFFFLVLPFVNQASSLDEDLFKAIKKGDCNGVKSALNAGASINAIDPKTKDNPLFCAVQQLVEAIVYNDSYSNLYQDNIYSYLFEYFSAFSGGYLFFVVTDHIIKKTNIVDLDDSGREGLCKFGGIVIGLIVLGLVVKAGHSYREQKISLCTTIVQYLLQYPQLNVEYCHESTHQNIKELIKSILSPKYIGNYYIAREGLRDLCPIDSAHEIVINGTQYVYRNKTYEKYIQPIFNSINKQLANQMN